MKELRAVADSLHSFENMFNIKTLCAGAIPFTFLFKRLLSK